MELSDVAAQLYGLRPDEFTAARNARSSDARQAGDRDLADSIKQLRKPTAGAAIANLLVREQSDEIEHLIELGASLRNARDVDGAQIRQATREKGEIVTKLLRHARTIAKRHGMSLSSPMEQALESTLDAAFSDPESAEAVRNACLTTALQWSGLGLGVEAPRRRSAAEGRRSPSAKVGADGGDIAKAKRDLRQAQSNVKDAEAEVKTASLAVRSVEADLQRLRAALTVATRRVDKAKATESNAYEKLERLRKRSDRK